MKCIKYIKMNEKMNVNDEEMGGENTSWPILWLSKHLSGESGKETKYLIHEWN